MGDDELKLHVMDDNDDDNKTSVPSCLNSEEVLVSDNCSISDCVSNHSSTPPDHLNDINLLRSTIVEETLTMAHPITDINSLPRSSPKGGGSLLPPVHIITQDESFPLNEDVDDKDDCSITSTISNEAADEINGHFCDDGDEDGTDYHAIHGNLWTDGILELKVEYSV